MFNWMARLLRSTLESIATPCSVKAIGAYRTPPQLEVSIGDLKLGDSSIDIVGKRAVQPAPARDPADI